MTKCIEAVADGHRTEQFLEGATCGGGHISYYLDIVSDETRDHERAWAEEGPSAPFEGWCALVRERIYWAHYHAVAVPHVTAVY